MADEADRLRVRRVADLSVGVRRRPGAPRPVMDERPGISGYLLGLLIMVAAGFALGVAVGGLLL
jgi:hypothetical protein